MSDNPRSLRALFELAAQQRSQLDAIPDSTNSDYYQQLQRVIDQYRDCRRAVEELSLFSSNETVDDISSGDLKYLLIDYYIAELTSRSNVPDRKAALRRAREEYSKFLHRLDAYDILSSGDKKLYEQFQEAPDTFSTAPTSDAVARREAKIARYREEKQLKEKLEHYRQQQQQQNRADVDEHDLRVLNLAQARLCVYQTFASLESIAKELQILAMAPPEPAAEHNGGTGDTRQNRERRGDDYSERLDPSLAQLQAAAGRGGPLLSNDGRPLQPFTLLDHRDRLRQGVFRPGHNLPTMTIEEYLEEEKRRGGIIDGGGGAQSGQRAEPDEDNMERADAETMKAREWDEFKEANPRGSGNTLNRG